MASKVLYNIALIFNFYILSVSGFGYTMRIRSLDTFHIVSYHIKWVKASGHTIARFQERTLNKINTFYESYTPTGENPPYSLALYDLQLNNVFSGLHFLSL